MCMRSSEIDWGCKPDRIDRVSQQLYNILVSCTLLDVNETHEQNGDKNGKKEETED